MHTLFAAYLNTKYPGSVPPLTDDEAMRKAVAALSPKEVREIVAAEKKVR